jgi:hypothetical protein
MAEMASIYEAAGETTGADSELGGTGEDGAVSDAEALIAALEKRAGKIALVGMDTTDGSDLSEADDSTATPRSVTQGRSEESIGSTGGALSPKRAGSAAWDSEDNSGAESSGGGVHVTVDENLKLVKSPRRGDVVNRPSPKSGGMRKGVIQRRDSKRIPGKSGRRKSLLATTDIIDREMFQMIRESEIQAEKKVDKRERHRLGFPEVMSHTPQESEDLQLLARLRKKDHLGSFSRTHERRSSADHTLSRSRSHNVLNPPDIHIEGTTEDSEPPVPAGGERDPVQPRTPTKTRHHTSPDVHDASDAHSGSPGPGKSRFGRLGRLTESVEASPTAARFHKKHHSAHRKPHPDAGSAQHHHDHVSWARRLADLTKRGKKPASPAKTELEKLRAEAHEFHPPPITRSKSGLGLGLGFKPGAGAFSPLPKEIETERDVDHGTAAQGAKGLWAAEGHLRARYIVGHWLPFIKVLRRMIMDLQGQAIAHAHHHPGTPLDPKKLPSQRVLRGLVARNVELTEIWYGQGWGNCSCVYEFFIRMNEVAGLVAIDWNQVPKKRSKDNFVVVFDGRRRNAARFPSAQASGGGGGESSSDADPLGQLPDQKGESPIDNSVHSNVMLPEEARRLLRGGKVLTFILFSFASLQRRYLRQIGEEMNVSLADEGPFEVREILGRLYKDHQDAPENSLLGRLKLRTDAPAFQTLLELGHVVSEWNHLPQSVQEGLNREVEKRAEAKAQEDSKAREDANEGDPKEASESSSTESKEASPLVREFVHFLRNHPGRVFRDDVRLHKRLLVVSMWKRDLVVLPRSAVERHAHERYLSIEWTRLVPLFTVDDDGGESVLREQGTLEQTRVRANIYPYCDSHGLGLGGGGVDEQSDVFGTPRNNLAWELGVAMPSDPQAKLANHWVCDVEKVVNEARLFNSRSRAGRAFLLPGEHPHSIGQNPAHSSSIAETLHTQIGLASLREHPVFQLEGHPQYCESLCADVDIIQVGECADAFFLKFVSDLEEYRGLVEFLQELRIAMMRKFGARSLDFNIRVVPDEDDDTFVIIFGVIGPVEQGDNYCWKNLETGESSDKCVAKSLGVAATGGQLVSHSDEATQRAVNEGRKCVAELYDVFRKPGARRFVRRFLLAKLGILDHSDTPLLPSHRRPPSVGPPAKVFAESYSYEGEDLGDSLSSVLDLGKLEVRRPHLVPTHNYDTGEDSTY